MQTKQRHRARWYVCRIGKLERRPAGWRWSFVDVTMKARNREHVKWATTANCFPRQATYIFFCKAI